MDIMVKIYAERPGMVIGRGGKNVRSITQTLKNEFGLDNPQIEVQEVTVPELTTISIEFNFISLRTPN